MQELQDIVVLMYHDGIPMTEVAKMMHLSYGARAAGYRGADVPRRHSDDGSRKDDAPELRCRKAAAPEGPEHDAAEHGCRQGLRSVTRGSIRSPWFFAERRDGSCVREK